MLNLLTVTVVLSLICVLASFWIDDGGKPA
jgi:hypothetical protein